MQVTQFQMPRANCKNENGKHNVNAGDVNTITVQGKARYGFISRYSELHSQESQTALHHLAVPTRLGHGASSRADLVLSWELLGLVSNLDLSQAFFGLTACLQAPACAIAPWSVCSVI